MEKTYKVRQNHKGRQVCESVTVQHRNPCTQVNEVYQKLDLVLQDTNLLEPIHFDEETHLATPFTNAVQRLRYFENLHLTVPVDLVKYSPGGSYTTVCILYRVDPSRSKDQEMTQSSQVVARLEPQLPEFHTRAMKRTFKEKFRQIAKVTQGAMETMYQEPSLDASAHSMPHINECLRLILAGETGLIPDLRVYGRPGGKYDAFFIKLEEVVEEVTAADDRRHGVAHLAEWISLQDLIDRAKARCSYDTLIPSKALVTLQFTPTNPYTHSALQFTSRINVQYKIQR